MPCRLRQIDTSGRSPLSGICYGAAGSGDSLVRLLPARVFTPVLIALLMAYLFNPVIRQAEARWRIPRPRRSPSSSWMALLLLGLMTWLGPLLAEQVQSFAERVPGYLQRLAQRYHLQFGDVSDHLSAIAISLRDIRFRCYGPCSPARGQAFGVLGTVISTTADVVIACNPDSHLLFSSPGGSMRVSST